MKDNYCNEEKRVSSKDTNLLKALSLFLLLSKLLCRVYRMTFQNNHFEYQKVYFTEEKADKSRRLRKCQRIIRFIVRKIPLTRHTLRRQLAAYSHNLIDRKSHGNYQMISFFICQ